MVRNITEHKSLKKGSVEKPSNAPNKRPGCKKSATIDPAQKLEQIFRKPKLQKPCRIKAKKKPKSIQNVSFQATSTPCNSVILESLEALRVDQVQRLIIEKKPVISKAPKKREPIAPLHDSFSKDPEPHLLAIIDVAESEPKKPESKKPGKAKPQPNQLDTKNHKRSKDTKFAKVKTIPKAANLVSSIDPINLLRQPKYYIVARKIKPNLKT